MNKLTQLLIVAIFLSTLVSGCLPFKKAISNQAEYDLIKPINCATAKEDIKVLQGEKSSLEEQAKSGVGMVVPVAAARAILHGDYRNRKEVLSGEYNADLDAKIKEIKNRCNLNNN